MRKFILSSLGVLGILLGLVFNFSGVKDINKRQTLEKTTTIFDTMTDLDENSNKTKLASYTDLADGQTITIIDNRGLYWDIIGNDSGSDLMQFSNRNTQSSYNIFIPKGNMFYGKDIDSGSLYSFSFAWGDGSVVTNNSKKTITTVYMDSDVGTNCLKFTYQSVITTNVDNSTSATYLWYPQHDHEWQTTAEILNSCTNGTVYRYSNCSYCVDTAIESDDNPLGHNTSTTGNYGIFNYTTCSRDGWTVSNGVFESSANIRNTDAYSDFADSWESQITLTFNLSVKSNINFNYYVSSEESCDELTVYLDGTVKLTDGGEVNKTYSLTGVSAGSHTLMFQYYKDSSVDEGDDLARISNLTVESAQEAGYVNLSSTSGSITYGTASKTFTVSSSSGTLSVSDNNATANVSISGTTVTISNLANINAGTTIRVTVTSAANSNYTAATATYTLTINKASISPSVAMSNYTYAGTKSTPSVSGNTGNGSVTYYYNTTNSNSGGTAWTSVTNATSLNAGTYYIYAVIAATTNYNAATTAAKSFTINKATGSITLSGTTGSTTYGTASKTFTATTNAGTLSVTDDNSTATVSISNGTVTIASLSGINAGITIKVTVSAAASTNYTAATATYTLTITKASISPSVAMSNYTYAGTKSTPSVSGNTGNGSVTYYYNTTNSNSGGTAWTSVTNATSLNAGTYYIYAVIAATTNYNGATTAAKSFTINKATGSITLSGTTGSTTYGTTSKTFTATTNAGTLSVTDDNSTATVSISNGTVTISSLSNINAGTTIKITVSAAASTNYTAATATYTLTITKASISPSVAMNNYTYAGTKSTPSVSGNTGNGSVTYYYNTINSNSGGTAWTNVTNATSLNAGTYYIYAVIAATTNYNAATTAAKSFTINKATGSITLSSTTGSTNYGTASKTFTATTNAGTLSVTDDNSTATVSISNGTVTIASLSSINAGTTIKVTVSAAASTNYTAATATYTLTITKASISPSVAMSNYIYAGTKSTPSVSGNTGNGSVTYYYNTTNSNSGGTAWTSVTNATSLNAGTYYIYAVIAATTNYNAATTAAKSFTINKATGSITLSGTTGSITYGTASKTFTASTNAGTLSVTDDNSTATVSISNGTVTIASLSNINAGTTIKVTVSAVASTNYTAASATYTLTINKATGSITLSGTTGSTTYGTASKTFTATTNAGTLSVTDDNSTATVSISNGTVTIASLSSINAGTTIKVTVSAAASTNYTAATATYTLTITKASISPSVAMSNYTYAGTKSTPSVSGNTGNGSVTYYYNTTNSNSGGTAWMSVTNATSLNAGTYYIYAVIAATTNYNAATTAAKSFTINKANLTKPTAGTTTYTYNGNSQTYVPTGFTAAMMSKTNDTRTTAGSQNVTITIQDTTNYQWSDGTNTAFALTFTIQPKTIGITWANTTFTYDGTAHIPSATATGLVSGDTCTITVTGGQTNAGTHTATASGLNNSNYALPTNKTASFTIDKAELSLNLAVKNQTAEYIGTPVALNHSYTKTATGLKGNDTIAEITLGGNEVYTYSSANYPASATAPTHAGGYTIALNGLTATADNYTVTITYTDGTLTITPKEITVSFTGYEGLIYTGNKQNITISLNGIIDGDICEYSVIGNEGTNAGTYTCEVSSITNPNYTLTGQTSLSWSIAKYQVEKPQEDSTVYTYTGESQTYQLSSSEYYTIANNTQTEAGTYTVIVTLKDKNNYEWQDGSDTDLEYTFKIEKKEVEIFWSDTTFTYNGKEQEQGGIIAYYLSLPNSQKNYLTVICNSDSFKQAGGYSFHVELDDTKNYTIANSTDSHSYTIEKASITLQAEDKEGSYQEAIQVLTYQVVTGTNYHGEISPVLTTTATSTSSVGTYPITIAAENDNYNITLVDGIYEIQPKAINVNILDQASAYTGEEPTVDQNAYTTTEAENLGITIIKEQGVSAGEYKLTAESTNTNYDITFIYTQGQYSVYTIEEADFTVQTTNYQGIYDGQAHSGEIEVGLEEGQYTIYYSMEEINETNYQSATTVNPTFRNAGKAIIYYYIAAKDYQDYSGSFTVEIAPKEITVSFTGYDGLIYTGSKQSITIALNGILAGEVCEYTVIGNEGTNAGTYTCEVSSITNANYTLTGQTSLSWSIAKAAIELTADNKAGIYKEALQELTYQVTGGTVYDEIIPVLTTTATSASSVGTYPITIAAENDNYNITLVDGIYEIKKADILGIKFTNSEVVYDGSIYTLEITGALPEKVSVSYFYNDSVFTGMTQQGSYTVTAVFTNENPNYNNLEDMTAVLTIQPKAINVNILDQASAYTGEEPTVDQSAYTTTEADDLGITIIKEQGVSAGEYKLTAEYTNTNYDITFIYTQGQYSVYTIEEADFIVQTSGYQGIYDGQAHSGEIEVGLEEGQYTIYYSMEEINETNYQSATTVNPTFQNAGKATIYYYIAAKDYQDSFGSFTVEIAPKEITVSFTGYDGLIYTGSKQSITISLNGIIEGDVCEYTVIGNEGINAGTYTCEVSSITNANYTLTGQTSLSWSIAKATYHNITHRDISIQYREGIRLSDIELENGYTFKTLEGVLHIGDNLIPAVYNLDKANYEDYELTILIKVNFIPTEELPKDENNHIIVDDTNYEDLKDILDDYNQLPQEEKDNLDTETKEELDKLQDALEEYQKENGIKTNPIIKEQPVASAILYGQTLEKSSLTGGEASVEGTFTFVQPKLIPKTGAYMAEVIFTPVRNDIYNELRLEVEVEVKAQPSIPEDGNIRVDDTNYEDLKEIVDSYQELTEEEKKALDEEVREELEKIEQAIKKYETKDNNLAKVLWLSIGIPCSVIVLLGILGYIVVRKRRKA